MNISHKYVIVSMPSPLKEGEIFDSSNWPLHLTLASVFKTTADPDRIVTALGKQASSFSPLEIQIANKAMFGPSNDVPVFEIEKNEELQEIHSSLIAMLTNEFQADFERPEYVGEGFSPHFTVRNEHKLDSGKIIVLDSLSFIDRELDNSPKKRQIIRTVKFGA